MHLRTMTKADVPSGMRLKDLAGWNQTDADWERFLEWSPMGCFVAESGGEVRGTVTTIVYESRFAWVGMVLVDPKHRGQGIGTRLLHKAIEYLDGLGATTIKLDATPDGKPIYEKLGFVTEYEIERWVLGERAKWPKTDSFPELRLGESASLVEILSADREAFGADRSGLLHSLHWSAPEFTAAYYLRGSLYGYTLGRHGSRADHLGPWMARSEAAAQQLLAAFLARSARETIFVDCMKANPFAARLLQSAGFGFVRPLTRMFRGTNQFPGQPGLFCGILGPEFG
jgi:GNAT superfamily N-acetyltransferase